MNHHKCLLSLDHDGKTHNSLGCRRAIANAGASSFFGEANMTHRWQPFDSSINISGPPRTSYDLLGHPRTFQDLLRDPSFLVEILANSFVKIEKLPEILRNPRHSKDSKSGYVQALCAAWEF